MSGSMTPTKGSSPLSQTGIWKMNMNTGRAEMILSLAKWRPSYPKAGLASGHLYFFREGWNPGHTPVTFISDPANHLFPGLFVDA